MPPPYMQSMSFKKMTIERGIEMLERMSANFEFVTMRVSNKPYRQWLKEQRELENARE